MYSKIIILKILQLRTKSKGFDVIFPQLMSQKELRAKLTSCTNQIVKLVERREKHNFITLLILALFNISK